MVLSYSEGSTDSTRKEIELMKLFIGNWWQVTDQEFLIN